MIKYWPNLKAAKGFSIMRGVKLAKPSNLCSLEEKEIFKMNSVANESNTPAVLMGHWANRDFQEYKNAA